MNVFYVEGEEHGIFLLNVDFFTALFAVHTLFSLYNYETRAKILYSLEFSPGITIVEFESKKEVKKYIENLIANNKFRAGEI